MTILQQIPLFSDIARPFSYAVIQSPLNYVTITVAGGTAIGSLTIQPQSYFVATAFTVFTNYDNVAPVFATANSNAILPRPFAPNNFTLKIDRGNNNKYSNDPMPQAMIASSGYRAGKVFPFPVVYGPRTNFQFTFQDTTGLFLLDALSEGEAVPMVIQAFLTGYKVPIDNWDRFTNIFPQFSTVFGDAPDL